MVELFFGSFSFFFFFFFNDTATTEIYTLSLHDALPIRRHVGLRRHLVVEIEKAAGNGRHAGRSEEHTSELQSRPHLVCRLLLEKKKQTTHHPQTNNNKTTQPHQK